MGQYGGTDNAHRGSITHSGVFIINRIVIPVAALFALTTGCAAMPADSPDLSGSVAFERFAEGDHYLEIFGQQDTEAMDVFGDIEVVYFDGSEEHLLVLDADTTPIDAATFRELVDPALRENLADFASSEPVDANDLSRGLAQAAEERLASPRGESTACTAATLADCLDARM
jgi:hypothetical protein